MNPARPSEQIIVEGLDIPTGKLRRLRAGLAAIGSAIDWAIGAGTLVIGLAILSAVPVAQFLSLGYLLEASGRVARTGRLRDAWIGVRRASRVGRIVAGCWLCLLPSRFVSSMATSAELIDPDGPVARGWRVVLMVVTFSTLLHLAASCARGGRARDFAWPPGTLIWLAGQIRRGGLYGRSRDATWDFALALRPGHYFRLGLLGFAGSMAWLVVPIALLAIGRRVPVLGLIGGLFLGLVAITLPFLQVRFAIEGRFGALFETRAIRERFRRAPWAFAMALLTIVAASIPLYLLKIEMVPGEIAGLTSVLFVGLLGPARVACGWAYARGGIREDRRHWFWRGTGRLGMIPIASAYVLIVFLAQYTSWRGFWSLAEQHAFLLPAPFLGY